MTFTYRHKRTGVTRTYSHESAILDRARGWERVDHEPVEEVADDERVPSAEPDAGGLATDGDA